MDYSTFSFRWGAEHLGTSNPAWMELVSVVESLNQNDILEDKLRKFQSWRQGGSTPPVGGQAVFNSLIESKLKSLGWESQIYCLGRIKDETGMRSKRLAYWTLDFKKRDIGVEVSFNNAGVLAQNVLRLSVMSENPDRPKEERIRLGILVCANNDLKTWSGMDTTVLTFESVVKVIPLMNFNIPTPIVVLGLHSSSGGTIWEETDFFSHKKLKKWTELSNPERREWSKRIDAYESSLDLWQGRQT